jgi:hypothetical protein
MFATSNDKNPVAVYKLYNEKRSVNIGTTPNHRFISELTTKKGNTDKDWFKSAPMGVNKLY